MRNEDTVLCRCACVTRSPRWEVLLIQDTLNIASHPSPFSSLSLERKKINKDPCVGIREHLVPLHRELDARHDAHAFVHL